MFVTNLLLLLEIFLIRFNSLLIRKAAAQQLLKKIYQNEITRT